jgi:DNA-binding response OmpR family regulator
MRILLVEDEQRLAQALAHLLKRRGYAVDTVFDGDIASELAATGVYDLLILDRMLPGKDGLTLLREFRRQGFSTPVLFLTAKDAPRDKVEGLDAGADDYLVKPFATDELLARIRALFRRQGKEMVAETLTFAGIIFDPLKCQVRCDGEIIRLTTKESLLLELLMRNCGKVLTKERIFEKVWGYFSETEMANVDLYIHYLRKKLNIDFIKTVRGVGYYLAEERNVQ